MINTDSIRKVKVSTSYSKGCGTKLASIILFLLLLTSCRVSGKKLTIVQNSKSSYVIVINKKATPNTHKAASIIRDFILQSSGADIQIISEPTEKPAIYVGNTAKTSFIYEKGMPSEGVIIHKAGDNIMICGGSGKGEIYAAYTFVEKFLDGKKYGSEAAYIPKLKTITLPEDIEVEESPAFEYREVYFPPSQDDEYLDWHRLHRLDDLWGLWGHSFFKLIPPDRYFKTHPEYFSLVKGKRMATQLCLSNKEVLNLVIADLKQRMKEHPGAMYWSISPNDDMGYCTCDVCSAIDKEEGGPQGSLIRFVNKVGAAFPEKKITTLAYSYTEQPPLKTKPADNVYIFLSDINAYRDLPLEQEPAAAGFRKNLQGWHSKTENIFIWDYVVEFTNYLAPFPDEHTYQANLSYLKSNGVKGMFIQGSGESFSDNAMLKSYLLSKLLWNTRMDTAQIFGDFYKGYYHDAAKTVRAYHNVLASERAAHKRKLDIYGNPINEWKSYLTPPLIERYSNLLDKAEAIAEPDSVAASRVANLRLSQEYVVLQQSKFYGIEKHGFYIKSGEGYSVKEGWLQRVERFVNACKKAGVTEMAEMGQSPDEYFAEWKSITTKPIQLNKAYGYNATFANPYVEDYPAKGTHTLTDGTSGYTDFSYNWLCFYGVPMIATIDMENAVAVQSITAGFLDDPRHRIFSPVSVLFEGSADGIKFALLGEQKMDSPGEERYSVATKNIRIPVTGKKLRYIRVTATPPPTLPLWRWHDSKKPMIACDEIWVQ